MSAPSFRSLSQGFSQFVDTVSDLAREGYEEVESTVDEWSAQAGAFAGAISQQANQVVEEIQENPESLALAASGLFLPLPLGAAPIARGLGRVLQNPVFGRSTRQLSRHFDTAGIGRPLCAPPEQIHRGLDVLTSSLNELFGFGPGQYLVSPGGTEHMNPAIPSQRHSTVATRTYYRVDPAEISIREYHRMDSEALAEILRAQSSGGEQ